MHINNPTSVTPDKPVGSTRGGLTFVEVPEEEQFAAAGSGGAHVTKQVHTGVPEDTVETQHHLEEGNGAHQGHAFSSQGHHN